MENRFIKYLTQPYPLGQNSWSLIFGISLFVSLFMVVFQPFGLASFQAKCTVLILSGYGLVTLMVLVFNLKVVVLLFQNIFDEDRWSVGREIGWNIYLVILIGFVNCLYSIIFEFATFSISSLLRFQFFTLIIAVIPIVVVIILNQNRLLRKNLNLAAGLNSHFSDLKLSSNPEINRDVCFLSDNEHDKVEVPIKELLYIESQGNYVRIYSLKDGKLTANTLRITLKSVENSVISHSEVIRCHRCYFVNLLNIESVYGNSQGYKLCVRGTDIQIPVSRAYVKLFQNSIDDKLHLSQI